MKKSKSWATSSGELWKELDKHPDVITDLQTNPTYGTIAAAKIRAECNTMSSEDREKNMKHAMKIINAGWKDYLKRLKAGDLFTVIMEISNLRGYHFTAAGGSIFVISSKIDSPERQEFKTHKAFLNWLVKMAKEKRNL